MGVILSRYPDYDKATTEYRIGLVEIVATYPSSVQAKFMDHRQGISAKCKFLPTCADFVAIGDAIVASEADRDAETARINDLAARVQIRRLAAPEKPLRQPVQFFDKYGNRISESEAKARQDQHSADLESMRKTKILTDYVRHLGGWDRAIELGIGSYDDVPVEWRA